MASLKERFFFAPEGATDGSPHWMGPAAGPTYSTRRAWRDAGHDGGHACARSCRSNQRLQAPKWPQPRKPRATDRGDGCELVNTKCRRVSTRRALAWAGLPHSKNTTAGRRALTVWITA